MQGSFQGVKRPRRGVVHPPPSSAEAKERVELYLCSLSGPSWLVLGSYLFKLFFQISASSGLSFRGSDHLYLQSVRTRIQEINVSGLPVKNIMRVMMPYALKLHREETCDSMID